jgi:hypothetical protein
MKKPIIDFIILPNDDPRFIFISDASMWRNIKDKPSIIEVIIPGAKNPAIVAEYAKGSTTSFNSKNLQTECNESSCVGYEPLEDGIYTITVKGSPDDFFKCRKYLHTANLRLRLDEMYVKNFTLCNNANPKIMDKLKEIDFLIKAAESHTRLNLISDAQELFFRAKNLVDKNCNNVCK